MKNLTKYRDFLTGTVEMSVAVEMSAVEMSTVEVSGIVEMSAYCRNVHWRNVHCRIVHCRNVLLPKILLMTTRILVFIPKNTKHQVVASLFIDCGSHRSFIVK
jgi:hypothetical protein